MFHGSDVSKIGLQNKLMGGAVLVGMVLECLQLQLMPGSQALVKCGRKLMRPRQVVKCDWGETFALLLDNLDLQDRKCLLRWLK